MFKIKDEGTRKVKRYESNIESDDSNLPLLIIVLIVVAIAFLIFG